jgi:signal transduction histidine kinase
MPQHGLAVTLDLTHESFSLPHDQATLLYQSIRELLINTVKHAQVDRALVSVSVDASDTLLIVVEDHGPGFNMALLPAKAAEKHFGLASMQQRMAAIGGSAQIHSAPGKGTRITLTIPLHTALKPLSLRAANAATSDRVIRKTPHLQDQQSLPLQ